MKTLAVILLTVVAAVAQTTTPATISATGGGKTVSVLIGLRDKTVISTITCAAPDIEPGETVSCTVSSNQAPRPSGLFISLAIPAGFTGPATVTIVPPSTSTTFDISRNVAPQPTTVGRVYWKLGPTQDVGLGIAKPGAYGNFATLLCPKLGALGAEMVTAYQTVFYQNGCLAVMLPVVPGAADYISGFPLVATAR